MKALAIALAILLVSVIFYRINTSKNIKNEKSTLKSDTSIVNVSSHTSAITTKATTSKATTTKKSITTVTVSTSASSLTTKVTSETEVTYSFPADINLVTAEQLMQIDGIGEVTAQKILDYRSGAGVICNMDMLLEIDGIGEATLDVLKEYLYVADYDYAEITTTSFQTTTSTTTTTTTMTTTTTPTSRMTTTTMPHMKKVNINTASAKDLSECLLIDIGLAEDIVELRTNIQYFVNDLELLYVDGFSKEMLVERRPYIEL